MDREVHTRPTEHLGSRDLFDLVQTALRNHSGRSETLNPRPERHYLLKGLIRCAHCLMPLWAQTYQHGQRYYREHQASRSHALCPSAGAIPPAEAIRGWGWPPDHVRAEPTAH